MNEGNNKIDYIWIYWSYLWSGSDSWETMGYYKYRPAHHGPVDGLLD